MESQDSMREKIAELREQVRYHQYRYHALDDPVVSDAEYDRLFRQLQELEKRYPEYDDPDSPTKRVGFPPLAAFQPFHHPSPMLSLENAFSVEEIIEFDRRVKRLLETDGPIDYVAEPKFDGVAIEIIYEAGRLQRAGTRGDGLVGEDVTLNVKTIPAIPLRLFDEKSPVPDFLAVRGEIYMEKEAFERLNQRREGEGLPLFANPRNAAAGSLRQLDSSITASRPLKAAFYGCGVIRGIRFETHWQALRTMKSWGLPVSSLAASCPGIERCIAFYRELEERRSSLPFDADGAVIKVDRIQYQEILGEKSRSPRWAIACKFSPDLAQTRVLKIDVQVGRTGVLTPVAHLEPVSLGGVTIRRATLHNQDEIERKDIRIGDVVVVRRAGDVIPEVVEVLKDKRRGDEAPFRMVEECPSCHGPVVRLPGESVHRCLNRSCPAQIKASLWHFAHREAMNIDGLGHKIISLLVDRGLVRTPADLYRLRPEQLAALPGLGEKSARNLVASIDKSKDVELACFIYALGIQHVGTHMAQLLVDHFGSLERIRTAHLDELKAVPGIGEKVAASIVKFFALPANRELVDQLLQLGVHCREVVLSAETSGDGEFWKGKSVVFTGSLTSMTRRDAARRVKEKGARVSGSVSRKTDLVVVGENPGSKLDRARSLGVKIIDEREFLEILERDRT